jgi:predicted dehydrogenase
LSIDRAAGQLLRVGVVGAGSWSRMAHVPGFRSTAAIDLVAICDVDRDQAMRVAAEASIPKVYDSTAAMLAAEQFGSRQYRHSR